MLVPLSSPAHAGHHLARRGVVELNNAYASVPTCARSCLSSYLPSSVLTYPFTNSTASTFCTTLDNLTEANASRLVSCVQSGCSSDTTAFLNFVSMVTECVSFVSSGPSSFPSNIPSSDPDATPSNNTGTFPSSDPSSSFPQPSSPATPAATSTGLSTTVIIAIAVPAAIVLLVVVIVAAVCIRRRNKAKQNPVSTGGFSHAGAPIGAGANGAPGTWQNQPGFSSPQTLYAGANGQPPPPQQMGGTQPLPPLPTTATFTTSPYVPTASSNYSSSAVTSGYGNNNNNNNSMASTASSSATAFTAPPRQQSSEPIPPANLYGDEKASGLFNPSVMGGSSSSSGYAPDTMFGDEKKKMAEAMLRVDAGASPSGLVLPFKTTMASSEDVARWSTLQVVVWLYSLGLREDIVLRLQERNIDGAQLITLNDARLQDLGVGPAPVRQSILSNLQTLRGHSGEVTADAGTGELAPPPYIPH